MTHLALISSIAFVIGPAAVRVKQAVTMMVNRLIIPTW